MSNMAKNKSVRLWVRVSAAIVALLTVISLVLTLVLPGLMDTLFGGERSERVGTTGSNHYFTLDEGITGKQIHWRPDIRSTNRYVRKALFF